MNRLSARRSSTGPRSVIGHGQAGLAELAHGTHHPRPLLESSGTQSSGTNRGGYLLPRITR